ncbi:MAG: polyprenyl synthetase family protein [Parvularculales bacterium]
MSLKDDETFVRQRYEDVAAVEQTLGSLLPHPADMPDALNTLFEAMRYGVLGGGKRFRPHLTLSVARLFRAPPMRALRVAAAVECVHAYSLIHDDLPCMDNDDVRHGQPTVHRQYGKAAALLAGNGLLTLAFEVLGEEATHDDASVRCALVSGLAVACGGYGMMGGQMLDITSGGAERVNDSRIGSLKTGALMGFACEAGAIVGGADEINRIRMRDFGLCVGRAFQIADDRLDADGTTPFERAVELVSEAVTHLECFGARADILQAAARFAIMREQ